MERSRKTATEHKAAPRPVSRHNRQMASLLSELKRRNVLRVAAAYALVSWILIEAGSVLLPTFGAPEWFFKVYVILVMGGFILSIIIAWVFEVTPDGVKLESDIDRKTYEPKPGGNKNVAIIMLLVVALGISITFNFTGLRGDAIELREITVHDSVAVLPFTSRSTIEENQFFADGIHEDILTRLAEIESLRVISRTSVNEYRDASRNLREIAENLGVSTVVEGSVQRSGDQVRISVQLIDVATDSQLWASTYDKQLSIESLFEIQTEISMQIASSLRSALTPDQEIRLATIPTDSIEAYAEYVAGRENLLKRNFRSLINARAQFENAVQLDPDYAQAHVALAQTVLVTLSNHRSIAPQEAYEIATEHLSEALRIDPEIAQAYAVRGLMETMQWEGLRVGNGNLAAASSFEKALQLNANLADAYVWFASLRQAEGKIPASIDLLTTALTIDPLRRIPYVNLPRSLAMIGQNERAIELLLHAKNIFPDWPTPYNYLANHLKGLGRLDEAVAWGLQEATLTDDPMTGGALIGIYQDFGDDDAITEFIESFPKDHPLYPVGKGYWHYVKRDYAGALAAVEGIEDGGAFALEVTYPLKVGAALLTEDFELAHEYLIKGNPTLGRDTETNVDRFNLKSAVLLAYVEQQLNRPQVAAQLLQQAEDVVRDLPRLGAFGYGIRDVQILTLMGRNNAAIDALTQAVDEGFVSSQHYDDWPFDEDPMIEPLRSDPKFDILLQRMDKRLEEMRQNVMDARESDDWSALLAKAESA
jgi:TolB-like protein/Tfp pilus assembly protein PilF